MEHVEHIEHTEGPKDMKAKIWRTFWILLGFTILDIALYFAFLSYHNMWKNALFILLGVVKAFYIVGIFMHMTFERKTLIFTIILPMIFVIFFIALMIIEGNFTLSVR